MEAPHDPANVSEEDLVVVSAVGETEHGACGAVSECEGEVSEVLEVGLETVTWDKLEAEGVWVDPADRDRTPPQFKWISHTYWRTPQPQINKAKMPRKHKAVEEVRPHKRQMAAIDRLGAGSLCQENIQDFMECEASCPHNSEVTNRETTGYMAKYHDGRQWGLHAIREYSVGDFVGEYLGEMVSGVEGRRRKREKVATSPSYLLAVGPRFVDAEHYGNALRLINHVCVDPNCRFVYVWVQGRLHISVTTIRPVRVGEEFTVAYGFMKVTGSQCHCGHEYCQQYMGDVVRHIPGTELRVPKQRVEVPREWRAAAAVARDKGEETGKRRRYGTLPAGWTPFPVPAQEAQVDGGAEVAGSNEASGSGEETRATYNGPPVMKYRGNVRFPAGLSFAVNRQDEITELASIERTMWWALRGRDSIRRWSKRALLRHTPWTAGSMRKTQEAEGEAGEAPPGRNGLRPLEGEALGAWIEATGWEEEEEARLQAEGTRAWGRAQNLQPLLEEDVRMLQSAGTWKPHVMATWLDWSVTYHSAVPAGSWVVGVGALHLAFQKQGANGGERLVRAKVKTQGPTHMGVNRATNFWFPLRDMAFGWGLIHADIRERRLTVWGRVPANLTDRAKQWMDAWTGNTSERGCAQADWIVGQGAGEWAPQDDIKTALQMAACMIREEETGMSDVQVAWASRLLPEVCREYGRDQDRRQVVETKEVLKTPPKAKSAPKPIRREVPGVRGTHRHMVWQKLRAEALRQVKRRTGEGEEDEARKDWRV